MEIGHSEVRKRFPGAFEALVANRFADNFEEYEVSEAVIAYTQTFTVDGAGNLWDEDSVRWDPARGWVDDEGEVVVEVGEP